MSISFDLEELENLIILALIFAIKHITEQHL